MINIPPLKPIDEEQEVQVIKQEVEKKYIVTPKYSLWEEHFFNKKNKETFGNATKSACLAYNLDPNDPKAYRVAANIGTQNVKKCKHLRKRYWEEQGMTHGKLLDLYNNMMVERKDVNMLYSVAQDIDAELPEYLHTTTPKNAIAQQNNFNFGEGGVNLAQLSDEQLKQFVESKRFALRSTSLIRSGETIEGEPAEIHSIPPEAIRGDSQ